MEGTPIGLRPKEIWLALRVQGYTYRMDCRIRVTTTI
jgi:hypothetical protein